MGASPVYSPDFIRQVVADYKELGSTRKAQQKYPGLSIGTISRWARGLGQAILVQGPGAAEEPIEEEASHPSVEYLDNKISEVTPWEILDAIETMQGVVGKSGNGQHDARVKITTDEPIVLVFSGDWHLGSHATDHKSWRRDLQTIVDTDHVFVVVTGDEIDNFHGFKSVGAVLGQVIPPKLQKRLLASIFVELAKRKKIVARTWGNHLEDFDDRVFGGDVADYNDLMPYLKDDGRLYLDVGGFEYRIYVKHHFRNHSNMNKTHGAKQAVRFDWPEADIAASGHTHDGNAIEIWRHGDLEKVVVKTGAYKTDDTYSMRYFGRSTVGIPSLVLWPGERKIVPFSRLDDAIAFRDAMSRPAPDNVVPFRRAAA
jgi:hypothetical protein